MHVKSIPRIPSLLKAILNPFSLLGSFLKQLFFRACSFVPSFTHDTKSKPEMPSNSINQHENFTVNFFSLESVFMHYVYLFVLAANIFQIRYQKPETTQATPELNSKGKIYIILNQLVLFLLSLSFTISFAHSLVSKTRKFLSK